MSRPKKWRRVCSLPDSNRFGPLDGVRGEPVFMTVDEYEALRLIDLERLKQEECAENMGVARTTVQAIYESARIKIAQSLINGNALIIEGGEYKLCDGKGNGCGRGCRRQGRNMQKFRNQGIGNQQGRGNLK